MATLSAPRHATVESLCATPKGSADRNEDRLVSTENFVAVIDGATNSGPVGGRSGGIVAAEAVAETIAALPAHVSARQFADAATECLAARLGQWPDKMKARPCASVVVWSAHRQEVWRVGDCHFRVDATAFAGEKLVDRLSYASRCAVVKGRLLAGSRDADVEKQRTVPGARTAVHAAGQVHRLCELFDDLSPTASS